MFGWQNLRLFSCWDYNSILKHWQALVATLSELGTMRDLGDGCKATIGQNVRIYQNQTSRWTEAVPWKPGALTRL